MHWKQWEDDPLAAAAQQDRIGLLFRVVPWCRFCRDMEDAGLEVEHYHGRFYWEGPAVRVDDLQEALSETKVPCQWDDMGLGYIVYPNRSAKLKEAAEA